MDKLPSDIDHYPFEEISLIECAKQKHSFKDKRTDKNAKLQLLN